MLEDSATQPLHGLLLLLKRVPPGTHTVRAGLELAGH